MIRNIGQKGDTIVEVLICMAIISAVLGAAYATAARSLRSGQQSQERTEALKLVESQFESLKFNAPSTDQPTKNIFQATTTYFCLNATTRDIVVFTGYTPAANILADDFTQYPAACKSGGYNLWITHNSGLFTVDARWDRLGGGRDEVKMFYRLNPITFDFDLAPPRRFA